jgi:transposase-like protein
MLFETASDKCPNCKGPLTLLSHGIRFEKSEIHEFDFRCDKCNRKYEFKDGELAAKPHKRDTILESAAARDFELLLAMAQ